MATVHGKSAYFALNDGAGLRNISAFLTSVEFSRSKDLPDSTTFGDSDHEFVEGLKGARITLRGFWDSAALATDATLDGAYGTTAAVAWEYGPAGNGGGSVKYSGNCHVAEYSPGPASVDALVPFSATLQVHGAVTRGTF